MHVFVDTYMVIHTNITGCLPRNSSFKMLVSGACFTIRASTVLESDVGHARSNHEYRIMLKYERWVISALLTLKSHQLITIQFRYWLDASVN